MQASITSPVVMKEQLDIPQDMDSNAPSRSIELAAPEHSLIPYTLDIQQEDNISIDMIHLYQVRCSYIKKLCKRLTFYDRNFYQVKKAMTDVSSLLN